MNKGKLDERIKELRIPSFDPRGNVQLIPIPEGHHDQIKQLITDFYREVRGDYSAYGGISKSDMFADGWTTGKTDTIDQMDSRAREWGVEVDE